MITSTDRILTLIDTLARRAAIFGEGHGLTLATKRELLVALGASIPADPLADVEAPGLDVAIESAELIAPGTPDPRD